jgi:hypothetical protein
VRVKISAEQARGGSGLQLVLSGGAALLSGLTILSTKNFRYAPFTLRGILSQIPSDFHEGGYIQFTFSLLVYQRLQGVFQQFLLQVVYCPFFYSTHCYLMTGRVESVYQLPNQLSLFLVYSMILYVSRDFRS